MLLLLLGGCCCWGVTPFAVLLVLLALQARLELTRACQRQGIRPNGWLSLIGALMPGFVLLLPLLRRALSGSGEPPFVVPLLLACGLLAAVLWETGVASAAAEQRDIHAGRNLACGLFCGAYLSLFSIVALLRLCPWQGGSGLALLTILCTMASDTGAFLVGRPAGRHQLAGVVSPRKTVEGLCGGIAASIATGGAAGYLLFGSAPFGLLIGAASGLFGLLGDLFASAVKRELRIKDFGTIIPGHGGVLDRFTSLLITSPVAILLANDFRLWDRYSV